MVRLFACAVGLLAGTAAAQTPSVDPVPVLVSAPVTPTTILTDPPPAGPPVIIVEDNNPVCKTRGSFDLLAGVFTGLRYQATLGPGGGPWAADIDGGFSAVDRCQPPASGFVGGHFLPTIPPICFASAQESLPYALFAPWNWGEDHGNVGGAVALDVDFTWKHAFSKHFEGTLGLKVGAAVIFGRGGVLPYPLPVCSVFFGCGF